MKRKSGNAIEILHNRYYRNKRDRITSLEQERINARIAHDLYALRSKSGLTQKQLAKLVGTTPSVISRLENADYTGHSLSMLQRIATVLNRRIDIKFVRVTARHHNAAAGEYMSKR